MTALTAWTWILPPVWAQAQQIDLNWTTVLKWALWLVVGFFGLFPGIVAYMVWAERKVAARFQDRIGPNRVGPLGLLQPIADGLKLLIKENIVPRMADQWVHILAPVLLLVSAFGVLAVMPFGVGMAPVDIPSGLLYLVAISSISTLGIFLAGWSSRNKYALLGSMRSVAQLVSYEVPQVLATVPVVLWAGSLSLVTIFDKQLQYGWFLFSPPGLVSFVILLIANIAEVNRTPFDLPEAESEIIAGYHTEYSGMRFGLFFLAEYLSVFGVSCLGTLLFLGGGSLPFTSFPASLINPQSSWLVYALVNLVLISVFAVKLAGFVFLMFWIRVTLPRLRVDQLMGFAWKNLVPMSIVNIFAAAVWYECYMRSSRPFTLGHTTLSVPFLPMNWIISSLITLAILVPSLLVIRGINRQERSARLEAEGLAAMSPTAPRLPAAARQAGF